MSIGGIVGGVVGGVLGFFVGNPFLGASIGFSIGSIIDPMAPDTKTPGMAAQPIQVMSNEIGTPVNDFLGTTKVVGHLLCYGKERAEEQYSEPAGGKGGGSSEQMTGYKYYASWQVLIGLGPGNTYYTLFKNDDEVLWEGEVNRPVSGGKETIVIEGFGSVDLYFGTADQVANPKVGEIITEVSTNLEAQSLVPATGTEGTDLNSPLRGFMWAFFDDCYIGDYNRIPTISFVVRRTPAIAFSDKYVIQTYDYNPMHAIWYWLSKLGGLPETWLHSADFAAAASTLYGEGRGITALLNQQQGISTYIETVNGHIDGLLRYGCDGKFHPKLIRNDYDVDTLPVITEDMLLEKPEFTRGSWIDTINEVKVQYAERIGMTQEPDTGPLIIDLVADGTNIFTCGDEYYDYPSYRASLTKWSMGRIIVATVGYQPDTNEVGFWNAVCCDDNYVYVGGTIKFVGESVRRAVFHQYLKSDLSLVWEYKYPLQSTDALMIDIDIAQEGGESYLYGLVYADSGFLVGRVKLRPSAMQEVWRDQYSDPDHNYVPKTAPVGIISDEDGGTIAYVCKGNNVQKLLDAVLKADGTQEEIDTGMPGQLLRGCSNAAAENLYVCGYQYTAIAPPTYPVPKWRGTIHCLSIPGGIENWRYSDLDDEGGYYQNCVIDEGESYAEDKGVFAIGTFGNLSTIVKVDLESGELIQKATGPAEYSCEYAIGQSGRYLYVGVNSSESRLGRILKISKDGMSVE